VKSTRKAHEIYQAVHEVIMNARVKGSLYGYPEGKVNLDYWLAQMQSDAGTAAVRAYHRPLRTPEGTP
jgi:hypothetical protein